VEPNLLDDGMGRYLGFTQVLLPAAGHVGVDTRRLPTPKYDARSPVKWLFSSHGARQERHRVENELSRVVDAFPVEWTALPDGHVKFVS
jgi:hypothetical protein